METVTEASATTYLLALMNIMMNYGICHKLVLGKDRKFSGVFCKVVDLLQLNCHVLSSQNHDGMLIEKINRYLNKGLHIICNEQGLV